MKAKVYSYFSPDVEDLNSFQPASAEEYGFLLTLSVGVEGEPGEEIFYLMVCTPEWIRARFRADQIVIGHHYLLVLNTDFENVERFVRDYIESCEGATWSELTARVGMLASSEFENDRVLERHRARIHQLSDIYL